MKLSRRQFLAASGTGLIAWSGKGLALSALSPNGEMGNPLTNYPNRGWEKVYRDQYKVDGSFTWVCSPNCTHECRLKAFTRNGVVLRTEQNYDKHRITDLYGVKASHHWNPRGCPNGFTFQRRMYGPYRLRYPMVRRGWKKWADDGFPELNDENKKKYKFDSRGTDTFVRMKWDDAYTYASKGFIKIAKTYSGEQGKKRLLDQGYDPATLTHWNGAGTRTMKFRGGMGLLGVIGKYGMYRFANTMSLLDTHVRGVSPKKARGGRAWSNYTWHGDQAPGHPFVHGLQASDCDFNDLRNSKLHIHMGKNLVENKRPDSHFFMESMERGAKIIVVAPEYSPPATKADYWIPIRPQTDTALLLGVTKILIDRGWYDAKFVKEFTDFPLLVRTDNLRRLRPEDIIPGYENFDISGGPSFQIHGLTPKMRKAVGDFMVWDKGKNQAVPISRDDVGRHLGEKNLDPALEGKFTVKLVSGQEIEVMPVFEMYKSHHLKDYDLDTVHEITQSPKELIEQFAKDVSTIKPAALHVGEGVNHWFHATMTNRAQYLPMSLTGNIGRPGAGCHTWAGNYKAALFQGSKWTGPGFKGWIAEDPFNPNLDPTVDGKDIKVRGTIKDEEPAYWNYGDKPLVVDTPKFGRKVFTGKTHMPSPTKSLWFSNVNIFNNAKWLYEMIKNVNPKIEMIICSEIELTSTAEYSDILLPANTWMEFEQPEITASCSNPFLQIWKGGVKPIYDTKDDVLIMAEMAKKMGELLKDKRFEDYWKFALDKKAEVYIQRLLDSSTPTRGYKYDDIMAGKYGESGTALMLFRSYPRIPFLEQIEDSVPFYSPTGRLQAYNDEPEVIEYGENLIVQREGPEGTPYLPNVIISSSPYIRPEDYGIPQSHMGWDERQVRNIKLPWKEAKDTKNPLWEAGYRFFCLTPKSRHTTHSSWQVTDWNFIWSTSFGDPYRMDRRQPGVGENQVQMNPEAAKDQGFNEGDYVYVDANPADRPYIGWKPNDPFYKVSRLMLRLKFNPAYPYDVVMIKHGAWGATEKSVKGHETRKDGRAVSADTGYQASYRYGSHQSITRGWLMPMHQLDSLFHKKKVFMSFMFGGEADNHAINTVPKETLVKLTKAEDGGLGGRGVWAPATTGFSVGNENKFMQRYLQGTVKVKRG
ncbi:MAG: molybdopterin-dependent oxidoreductase [Nitrospinaceae bacterium]|jgi:nitrate reductase / nitrite oxidoreductase, alpha subunit|nr:molybdopterin-dependent oxidoreductase [Nitrospinaceae bacterium]MBT3820508.1 molybdopterin-dependent oxidoreductase [Nitrospinaceae bacterium]MBT5368500.1 molybdopterin-dependent oxidoreductase [Nitrospinaceae bacterium]MBT5947854.1 molybdopterin-dependent oxidoreductase [Nitrospinaceae bacterium]MBT6395813.1 molybdopterin-dependent oxidoreductase [Nitrospinaceae bacterium]